jgi:hypothetical protein
MEHTFLEMVRSRVYGILAGLLVEEPRGRNLAERLPLPGKKAPVALGIAPNSVV